MDSLPVARCSKCGEEKPHTAELFSTARGSLTKTCRVCQRINVRKWQAENADKVKGYKAKYRQNSPEKVAASHKKYKEKHPERVKLSRVTHFVKNRPKWLIYNHNRRARIHQASGKHFVSDVRKQIRAQDFKCYWCKCSVENGYEVDHIFALADGGSNGPENICISCVDCNRRKSTRTPLEFAGRLF